MGCLKVESEKGGNIHAKAIQSGKEIESFEGYGGGAEIAGIVARFERLGGRA